MTSLVIPNRYTPLPPQMALRRSAAVIRGFGGAMGGGKSRALCEEVFDWMLEYPGAQIPVFRNIHTHITASTRKTFIEQVLPPELRARPDLVRIVDSGGKDFVELWNGSAVHFVGLDNPGRWFSTEIAAAAFDEAHEIQEEHVQLVYSRLRQRCSKCILSATPESVDCEHMPHRIILTFNPSYPGHWLQEWFILGAQRTEYGYRKEELRATDSDGSMGDAEFFISLATQNPYLPSRYIERNLASFDKIKKLRYLDGIWAHGAGSFFDDDALNRISAAQLEETPLIATAEPVGDVHWNEDKPPRLAERGNGRMEVYAGPKHWKVDDDGTEHRRHRYVVAVDASSGVSSDYSAVQVIDVEEFEQVAEWQGKVDPDKLAEVAFLTACVYNGATLAPEITGGWGFAVVKRCQQMIGNFGGPPSVRPSLYMRPIVDRLSNRFTDLLGWDTNTKSRAQMLDLLEEAIRDGSLLIHGRKTMAELAAFAIPDRIGGVGDYRSPRAQKGAHDDLVIALAIGVAVATRLPKNTKIPTPPIYQPSFSVTGY